MTFLPVARVEAIVVPYSGLNSSEQPGERSLGELDASTHPNLQRDDKLKSLSTQERNIARNLKQGKSNQAIASELFLTAGTVKNYIITIYRKLHVTSRSEAIAYLHEHDLDLRFYSNKQKWEWGIPSTLPYDMLQFSLIIGWPRGHLI